MVPDFTLWLAQKCGQLSHATTTKVPSGSNPQLSYTVTVRGNTGTCTCPGNHYRGRCKHVEQALAALCTWTSEHGAEQQSLQQNVSCVCPRCLGPTELARVAA